jgi:tetratricopeptide (TPR) repeat protein
LNISKRTVPDFKLIQGDAKQLVRICQLVEGMPLGLELAASWVGLLPLSVIATELEQSLHFLTTVHHDVPQRHHSMQATLDVSWKRLNSEQKHGFQELTVFRGGFTRMAALEIAGVTLPVLVTLANKSWLSYDWERDRYNIHELLRQYGAGKLNTDTDRGQAVRDRHSAYFCSYLKEREADWFGARQQNTVAEMQEEIDNIQNAWRWAANQGDGLLLAQGLNSLCRFYLWEGRMKDGQHACRSAGEGLSRSLADQRADDPQRMALWARILASESQFVKEVTYKEKLLAQSQNILDRVVPSSCDTRTEQAFIYLTKAYAALYTDLDKAIPSANLGLELFQELGDRWGEAETLQVLGVSYYFRGDFDLANDLLRTSLDITKELGDAQGIAETVLFLGVVAKYKGHFAEAEALHRQSLNLFQQLGNQWGESLCLGVLSYTLAWAGKFFAAYETAELAIKIDQELGQYPIPSRLNPLTKSAIHLGHYDKARTIATESLKLARQSSILSEAGWALMYLGNIAFVEGDFGEAKRYLLECEATLAELKHIHLALPRAILSYVVRAQGDRQLAPDYLISALVSGIEYRSIYPIIYCLPAAALLAADDGRPQRAIELYGLAQQYSHITNSRWFEAVACHQLDDVRTSLAPEVALAAEAKGRELDLWEAADELRLVLTNS